jgi:hypothetical protein
MTETKSMFVKALVEKLEEYLGNYLLVLEREEEMSKYKINGLNHKGIKIKDLTM